MEVQGAGRHRGRLGPGRADRLSLYAIHHELLQSDPGPEDYGVFAAEVAAMIGRREERRKLVLEEIERRNNIKNKKEKKRQSRGLRARRLSGSY